MDDVVGPVGAAEIAVAQVRACGILAQVGHGHVLGRQDLAGHDLAVETDQTGERVAVQHERCHEVGEEVTPGARHVRLGHQSGDIGELDAVAHLVYRQACDGGLQHLHATEHGGQLQRLIRRGTRRRPDAVGHVHVIAAAGEHPAGESHSLPKIHACHHARGGPSPPRIRGHMVPYGAIRCHEGTSSRSAGRYRCRAGGSRPMRPACRLPRGW